MLFTISLTNNKDFLRLYRKGFYVNSKECVVYYQKTKLPYNRLGITTGKKIGNAVKRNRARRVIRAAYAHSEVKLPVGYDIVVVARANACEVKSDKLENFFQTRVIADINKRTPTNQKS